MKTRDQDRLAEHVTVHRIDDSRARRRCLLRRTLRNVELGVEGVELEGVVMVRPGRCSRAHVGIRAEAHLTVPSGDSPAGTASGSPVDVPGIFQMSQCVMSIFEPFARTGSGSCISSTKLCVPGGTCDHFNSGDTALGPAAIVYLSGMT